MEIVQHLQILNIFLQNSSCQNCNTLHTELQRCQSSVIERDKTIAELKTICSKFEHQLLQQDSLSKLQKRTNKLTTVHR